jgi:hypothetical protein
LYFLTKNDSVRAGDLILRPGENDIVEINTQTLVPIINLNDLYISSIVIKEGFYMVDLNEEIKLISEYSHGITRFDNYLVYYRSNDLTTGMVRTKNHNSIEITDKEKSISFIPNIGYGNIIVGSRHQLTVENDKTITVKNFVFPDILSLKIPWLNSVNNISSEIRLRNNRVV